MTKDVIYLYKSSLIKPITVYNEYMPVEEEKRPIIFQSDYESEQKIPLLWSSPIDLVTTTSSTILS